MKKYLLALAILLVASCASQEESIKREIESANFCETKEDCILVGSKCPFDCYIYSNAKEADRIKNLVDSYESACAYSCIMCDDVACENGKCKPVCESP